MLGAAFTAISSLMAGLASSFWALILWRFAQGAGSAFYMVAATTKIGDMSAGSPHLARRLSFLSGAHLLGTSFGPSFGGIVAQIWGYRVPFFIFAGLATTVMAAVALGMPERDDRSKRFSRVRERACCHLKAEKAALSAVAKGIVAGVRRDSKQAALFRNRNFILIAVVEFNIFFVRAGARQTIVPLLGAMLLGLGEKEIGFVLTVIALGNLATIYLAGWLADHLGAKKAIVPSLLVASGGFLLFAGSHSYLQYLLAGIVLGVGTGIGGPVPNAYAMAAAPDYGRGLAIGTLRAFGDLGFILGPLLLGLVADFYGYREALTLTSVLMGTAVVVFGIFAKELLGPRAKVTV